MRRLKRCSHCKKQSACSKIEVVKAAPLKGILLSLCFGVFGAVLDSSWRKKRKMYYCELCHGVFK